MALSSALVLVFFDVRKTGFYVKEKLFREEKQFSKVRLLLGASILSMASSTLVAVFNGVPKIMVEKMLDEPEKLTPDMGGSGTTAQVGDGIVALLRNFL